MDLTVLRRQRTGTGRSLRGGVVLDVGTAGLRRAAAAWSADLDAVAP
jgi:hypothetical protein